MDETGRKAGGLSKAFGAVTVGSRGLHSTFGLLGKGAALAAGAAGVGGLIEGFKGVYSEGREAQKAAAQTTAVIKSTGGAAHVSANQVGDLATAISNKVGVDDEAIQSGANLLLTFTKVRNETGKGNQVFDRATQTVTDMAAAMNNGAVTTDGLKSASIQVGKALNDPLKGITALTKVGVTFDAGQKQQIATLVKHHDTLGAQKIILGELNKEFGGSAAAGTTASQQLGVVFGNIEEAVGTALLPAIDKASDWLSKKLPGAVATGQRVIGDFAGAVKDGLNGDVPTTGGVFTYVAKATTAVKGLSTWITDTGVPAIETAFTTIKLDLSPVATAFATQAKTWGGALITGVKTGLDTGDWSGLGETVGRGISSAIEGAGRFAKDVGTKIGDLLKKVDWVGVGISVGKQVPSLLVGLAAGILNFDFMGLLGGLAQHWQDVLLAIIAVAFTPARILGKVGEVLAKIPFAGKLLAWGLEHFAAFSKGIFKMAGDAVSFIGKAFLEGFQREFPGIGTSFLAHLRNLPTYVRIVALELRGKAAEMMKGLADSIAGGIARVVANIGQLIAKMIRPFANAGGWLVRHGIDLVGGLLRGVISKLGAAGDAAARVGRTLLGKFTDTGSWLSKAGSQLIQGLLQGALGKLKDVGQWAKDIGTRVVRAVKDFFQISSPSKVFAGLGGHLIGGLIKGMVDKNPVAMVKKVFGGMTGALKALFSKHLLGDVAHLGGKALSALGGLAGNLVGVGGKSSNAGNETLVRNMAATFFGWSGREWDALRAVIMRESGFNNTAQNPTSSAFGMFQFLDSTWGGFGVGKTSNPNVQATAGLQYVKQRYGDPINAWGHETQFGWYANGMPPTVFSQPTLIGVGERGPETVTVVPHNRAGGGPGGGDTYITVNIPGAVGDRAALKNWVVTAVREAQKNAGKPVTV